jgi:hypothetical protein
MHFHSGWSGLA